MIHHHRHYSGVVYFYTTRSASVFDPLVGCRSLSRDDDDRLGEIEWVGEEQSADEVVEKSEKDRVHVQEVFSLTPKGKILIFINSKDFSFWIAERPLPRCAYDEIYDAFDNDLCETKLNRHI